eukprot:6440678-Prymnesium_polylepis.1
MRARLGGRAEQSRSLAPLHLLVLQLERSDQKKPARRVTKRAAQGRAELLQRQLVEARHRLPATARARRDEEDGVEIYRAFGQLCDNLGGVAARRAAERAEHKAARQAQKRRHEARAAKRRLAPRLPEGARVALGEQTLKLRPRGWEQGVNSTMGSRATCDVEPCGVSGGCRVCCCSSPQSRSRGCCSRGIGAAAPRAESLPGAGSCRRRTSRAQRRSSRWRESSWWWANHTALSSDMCCPPGVRQPSFLFRLSVFFPGEVRASPIVATHDEGSADWGASTSGGAASRGASAPRRGVRERGVRRAAMPRQSFALRRSVFEQADTSGSVTRDCGLRNSM